MSGEGADRKLALFHRLCDSTAFLEILSLFEELCGECGVDHRQYHGLVQELKTQLTLWKCQDIFKIYETKANHPVYRNQECCRGMRCLVIGAGPVGLRSAIEAALLGAKVEVVEKRSDFSRNNVLHLWPFLLTDLRNLGAKKFYGKFCSGDLDHISIRMLQTILLKAALLLGVKVHPNVEFKSVIEPGKGHGWKVAVSPSNSLVGSYEFDVMIGADGKKYVLPGFRTKEFRPKLAIAITANFVNHGTQEEANVKEISGISYVYHQDFFNRLSEEFGIELENVVYYRDETHYFVMTAKKQSLLRRGVLKQDFTDAQQLLSSSNISPPALKQYAKEVAVYSTKGGFKMESLEFQKNHRGEDDVALFDFTSLYAAENAARIVERGGKRALMCLVGDSLIEPFWPTGSGCARGFLGVMDAAWMMKGFGEGRDPLELIEVRESTLQLLSQTKPERLHKNYQTYTIDPSTRYLDIAEMVAPGDITHLYDTGQGPQVPTVIIKSGIANTNTKKRGLTRDKRYKTIGGIHPRKESGTRIDLDFLKTWSSSTSPPPSVGPGAGAKGDTAALQMSEGRSQEGKSSSGKTEDSTKPKGSPKVEHSTKSKQTNLQPCPSSKPTSQPSPSSPGPKTKQWFKRPRTPKSGKETKEPPTPPTPEGGDDSKQLPKPKSRLKQLTSLVRPSSPKKRPTTPKKTEKESSPKLTKQPKTSSPKTTRSQEKHSPKSSASPNVQELVKYANSPKLTPGASSFSQSSQTAAGKGSPKALKKQSPKRSPKKVKSLAPPEQTAQFSGDEKFSPSSKKRQNVKMRAGATISHSKSLQDMSIGNRVSFFQERINTGTGPPSPAKVSSQSSSPKKSRQQPSGKGREGTDYHSLSESGSDDEQDSRSRLKRKSVSMMELSRVSGAERRPSLVVTPSASVESFDGESSVDSRSEVAEGSDKEKILSEGVTSIVKRGLRRRSSAGRPVTWAMDSIPELDVTINDKYSKLEVPSNKTKSTSLHRTRSASPAQGDGILQSQAEPLWLARYIASLNKCLETLRRENDVIESKTALEILNTITSNVEEHPEDEDRFRRVRVSSQKFHEKVWNHRCCRNFLLKSGWVEIDDFIVAPIGKSLAQSLRVVSKHLSIVNNMIWSMQIELPTNAVEVAPPTPKRRSSLKRRESYATEVVNSALDRVAQAAMKIRNSPSPTPISEADEDDDDKESADYPIETSSMSKERASEVETMRAAVSARKKWLNRLNQATFTKPQVEWKPFLEVELYGDAPHIAIRRKHSGSSLGKEDRLSGNFDKVKTDMLRTFQGESTGNGEGSEHVSSNQPTEYQSGQSKPLRIAAHQHPPSQSFPLNSRSISPIPRSTSPAPRSASPTLLSTSPTPRFFSSGPQSVSPTPRSVSPTPRSVSPTPHSMSSSSSQSSSPEKKDSELNLISRDASVRKFSIESMRSISEEDSSEGEEVIDEVVSTGQQILDSVKLGTPETADVASIRELWVKRTYSSETPAPLSPVKNKSSSLQRRLSPSSASYNDSSHHPVPGTASEQPSLSRSKTMPAFSTALAKQQGGSNTVKTESIEMRNEDRESVPLKKVPFAANEVMDDRDQLHLSQEDQTQLCESDNTNINHNNNNSNRRPIPSSKSVPNISGKLDKREEDRMVLEAGRLAHEMARNMFS